MIIRQKIIDLIRFLRYGDLPTSYYVKKGMKVGGNFMRQSGTRLDPSNCWLIEIGDDVIMGNKSQIIAHDFSMMHHTGFVRFGRVKIGNRVFIGANTTILMNVHIGNDVIIGADSLVNRDIPDGCVVAGVPARVICKTSDYIAKQNEKISKTEHFKKSDTNYDGYKMSTEKKKEMLQAIDNNEDRVLYIRFRDFRHVVGSDETKLIEMK